MFLWKMLLLSRERASVCGGRDHGGIFNPVAAGRLAIAETQAPVGTHVQRGETGQVGEPHLHLQSHISAKLSLINRHTSS